jgi:hypothetical protein
MSIVQAASLAPSAFGLSEDADDTLDYDLGNMAAFDTQPVDPSAFASGREAALRELAQAGAQALIRRLFLLPVEQSEVGPLVRINSLQPNDADLALAGAAVAPHPNFVWSASAGSASCAHHAAAPRKAHSPR